MIKSDGTVYVPQSVYQFLEDGLLAGWYPSEDLYRNEYMVQLPFAHCKVLEVRNSNNVEDSPIRCNFTVDCKISYTAGARGFVVRDLYVNLRPQI